MKASRIVFAAVAAASLAMSSCELVYGLLGLPNPAEKVPSNVELEGTFDLTSGYIYDAWDMDADSLNIPSTSGRWYKFIVGPRVETQYDKIWGSNPYTGDSSVAFAALHAGAIDEDGGTFYILTGGQGSMFYGSLSNGILSVDYDNTWDSSYTVYTE